MDILIWILVFLATFAGMEFNAWFTHKYIMHGFLWHLHKDHHQKDHDSWFERNDTFFIFYAVVSITFFLLWQRDILAMGCLLGWGFLLMDVLILWSMTFLYTNVLNGLGMPIRDMEKQCGEHIKYITNI